MDLTNKTPEEIENIRIEKDKELQSAQNDLQEVYLKKLDLDKQIILLEQQKKEYQILISKARHIVSTLKGEIAYLTTMFWRARR